MSDELETTQPEVVETPEASEALEQVRSKLSAFGVPFKEEDTLEELQKVEAEAEAEGVFAEKPAEVVLPTVPVITPVEDDEPATAGVYFAISRLKHNGGVYNMGDAVELDEETAKRLVADGIVRK